MLTFSPLKYREITGVVAFLLTLHSVIGFAPHGISVSTTRNSLDSVPNYGRGRWSTLLRMAQSTDETKMKEKKANFADRSLPLSAFTTTATGFETELPNSLSMPKYNFDVEGLISIFSSSLLITGNTVGAGTIILPQVAAEPGMLPSLELIFGIFTVNLISGLLIGEVAIKQYEQNEDDSKPAPSSFKDLADDLLTFDGIDMAQLVSVTSILINYCILSFALMRSGEVAIDLASALNLADAADLSQTSLVIGFSGIVAAVVSSQSRKTLSQIASCAVTLLFLSFGSILMPGLANMQQDIMTTLTTQGTYLENASGSLGDSMATAAPIFVATMVYQNIVPTVTKLLDFDRAKVMTSLAIGSAIPALIYVAWCFAVMGGGVSIDSMGEPGLQSMLLLAFSVASIGGSSIGCVMSLAEECKSQLSNFSFGKTTDTKNDADFSLPVVGLAIIPPLVAGMMFSNGGCMTTALGLAGSYGSPLLYGVLPALLAWKQKEAFTQSIGKQEGMVPGGEISSIFLAVAATGFIGMELFGDLGSFL